MNFFKKSETKQDVKQKFNLNYGIDGHKKTIVIINQKKLVIILKWKQKQIK